MKYCSTSWTCVFALVVFPLVGCSDESVEGTGGTGDTSGTGGTAGTGGPGTVTLAVTVTEAPAIMPFGGLVLEGVELCETDTTNCATTNAQGLASILLPADQEVSYTLAKEGYTPYLVADVTDATFDPVTNWPMFSDALTVDAMAPLGITPPFMGGTMVLRALSAASTSNPGIVGATYDLVDETAAPFYQEAVDWTGSFALTATTSNGQGGFVELASGEYQAEFGGTAMNCTPAIAWPGDSPNRVKVPIRDGHFTYSSMNCDAL